MFPLLMLSRMGNLPEPIEPSLLSAHDLAELGMAYMVKLVELNV